ncbi:MAG: TIGR04053 family radical SAM/SPASM domain-containing protein [Nitriliruptoraceae bacterium]
MRDIPVRHVRYDVNERPFLVIWEVTKACQLVCQHCRADAVDQRHPRELSTADGMAMLDELADLGAPPPLVVLTGGDPFERDDLFELLAHGAQRGLSMAQSPSVTARLTPESIAQAKAAGARAVSLSLDGAVAATHDMFRGIAGVFDATITAARDVRQAGLRLQINTTVTRSNARELPAILQLVEHAQAWLWSVFFLVPTGRGANIDAPDPDETEAILHWLHDVSGRIAIKTTEAPHYRRIAVERTRRRSSAIARPPISRLHHLYAELRALTDTSEVAARPAARPPLDINAGRGFVFIDHLGIVYPSGFLPVAAGSVRSQPLLDIYRNAPLMRMLRDPKRLHGACGSCGFADVCGGSRSRAFALTGDVFADDPACVLAAERV